jgi:hypothetical protein
LEAAPRTEYFLYGSLRYRRKDEQTWALTWGRTVDSFGVALDEASEAEIQDDIRRHPRLPRPP